MSIFPCFVQELHTLKFLLFIRVHISAQNSPGSWGQKGEEEEKKERKKKIFWNLSTLQEVFLWSGAHFTYYHGFANTCRPCILYHQIFNGKKRVGSLWLPIWTVKRRQEIRCRANGAEPRIQGFPTPFWRRNFFRFFHHQRTWPPWKDERFLTFMACFFPQKTGGGKGTCPKCRFFSRAIPLGFWNWSAFTSSASGR